MKIADIDKGYIFKKPNHSTLETDRVEKIAKVRKTKQDNPDITWLTHKNYKDDETETYNKEGELLQLKLTGLTLDMMV